MKMQSITRTIREQVTERIRDQVVAGEFAPGEALRETDFAARFGVSRGPVRDAFLQLAQEGILDYEANRGVTVSPPPKPENRALIVSLRRQVECFVVKRGLKRLDDEALARMEGRLKELRAACDGEDATAVVRSDLALHETLLRGCGGEDFLPVWKWLCSRMLMAYSRLDNYRQVYREHAEIVRAIRAGKKPAVLAAIRANIQ